MKDSWIISKSGKAVLKVMHISVRRRAGEPPARDNILLTVERQSLQAVPAGVTLEPWPIAAKVIPAAKVVPAAVSFRAAAERATASVVGPRSRKQIKRDNQRTLRARFVDLETHVPAAQRNAVLDKDGKVVIPPKVVAGSWQDPDDTNVRSRMPRMSHGFKPYDPIAFLAIKNPDVKVDHVVAANFYRLAHQLGPEAGFSSGRDLVFCDRQFGTSQGPTDAQCDKMKAWRWVQSQFLPREQLTLQVVVLDRTSVNAWARAQNRDPSSLVGYLVNILERLLSIYQDDVDSFMRQERVQID